MSTTTTRRRAGAPAARSRQHRPTAARQRRPSRRPRRPSAAARRRAARRRRARLARSATVLLALAGVLVLLGQPWTPPARALVVTAAPYVQQLPDPPRAFPGGADGCAVADPTGSGGCVTAASAWLLTELETAFGDQRVSCWSEHAWNPASDHPAGRACDVFPGQGGVMPTTAQAAHGWHVAQWARHNAEALGVEYVIWYGRIWTYDRPERGWAPYDGGGVYDRTDPTGGHYDHVHISMREA